MTKNEAASVAQLTDEQIDALGMEHGFMCIEGGRKYACDMMFSEMRSAIRSLLAQAAPPAAPVQGADGVRWDMFPAWLIDHCEGDTITEEGLQFALADMLKVYPAAPATGESGAEPYRQRSARLSAGRLSDAERAAIEALYATPPAARSEAASQPGEMVYYGGGKEPEPVSLDASAQQDELIDKLRNALEMIGGGDSRNPQADAADALVQAGVWTEPPKLEAQQDEPMEWRIEVAGPSGYVRFETFQGVTLDDALDSAVAQNFYPAQDEDGWTRIEVKV